MNKGSLILKPGSGICKIHSRQHHSQHKQNSFSEESLEMPEDSDEIAEFKVFCKDRRSTHKVKVEHKWQPSKENSALICYGTECPEDYSDAEDSNRILLESSYVFKEKINNP